MQAECTGSIHCVIQAEYTGSIYCVIQTEYTGSIYYVIQAEYTGSIYCVIQLSGSISTVLHIDLCTELTGSRAKTGDFHKVECSNQFIQSKRLKSQI